MILILDGRQERRKREGRKVQQKKNIRVVLYLNPFLDVSGHIEIYSTWNSPTYPLGKPEHMDNQDPYYYFQRF